jgi:hypothetical protein
MKPYAVDLKRPRIALRQMSRGNLLMVAERATGNVPRAKLRAPKAVLRRLPVRERRR